MNLQLLEETKQDILQNPQTLIMEEFYAENADREHLNLVNNHAHEICGTAACIAGRITDRFGYDRTYAKFFAKLLLRLTMDQANRLFYLNKWPETLRNGYLGARTALEAAKITAQRIDLFIQTQGAV